MELLSIVSLIVINYVSDSYAPFPLYHQHVNNTTTLSQELITVRKYSNFFRMIKRKKLNFIPAT